MALSFMALYVHSANTCNQYNTLVIIQTHRAHLSTVVNTKTTKLTHQSESQHPYKKRAICLDVLWNNAEVKRYQRSGESQTHRGRGPRWQRQFVSDAIHADIVHNILMHGMTRKQLQPNLCCFTLASIVLTFM